MDTGHPFLCIIAGALWDPAWHLLCHICVPCTQCIGFPGYRSHNYIDTLRPTQVSMLLGCESGLILMITETPPHTLCCVYPQGGGSRALHISMQRHRDNISAHMTFSSRLVDGFIQSLSQSQSISSYRARVDCHKQPMTVAANPHQATSAPNTIVFEDRRLRMTQGLYFHQLHCNEMQGEGRSCPGQSAAVPLSPEDSSGRRWRQPILDESSETWDRWPRGSLCSQSSGITCHQTHKTDLFPIPSDGHTVLGRQRLCLGDHTG